MTPPKFHLSQLFVGIFFWSPRTPNSKTPRPTPAFPRNGEDYVHRVGRTGALRWEVGCWSWLPESGPNFWWYVGSTWMLDDMLDDTDDTVDGSEIRHEHQLIWRVYTIIPLFVTRFYYISGGAGVLPSTVGWGMPKPRFTVGKITLILSSLHGSRWWIIV